MSTHRSRSVLSAKNKTVFTTAFTAVDTRSSHLGFRIQGCEIILTWNSIILTSEYKWNASLLLKATGIQPAVFKPYNFRYTASVLCFARCTHVSAPVSACNRSQWEESASVLRVKIVRTFHKCTVTSPFLLCAGGEGGLGTFLIRHRYTCGRGLIPHLWMYNLRYNVKLGAEELMWLS